MIGGAPVLSEVDEIVLSFQRNVVVAASAGTGKTHRLTALYVLVTLGLTSMGLPARARAAAPVLPDRIWATTFTRAAAREIAERVEAALAALAQDPRAERAPFAAEIAARSAALDDPPGASVIKRRAAEALARWPAARIDTLHGLAGRIVDRHGLALGLPPGMRVLDEDESSHLAALAIDEVLGRSLGGGEEGALAARTLLLAAGGVAPLRMQLTRLFDRLDEEGTTPEALALADHAAAAREQLAQLVRVARAAAGGSGIAGIKNAAAALVDVLARSGEGGPILPPAAVPPLLDLLSVPMRGKKRDADDEVDAFRKSLGGGSLRPNAEKLVAFLRHAEELGAREAAVVRLLSEARAAALARRRRAGALGFGDLLRAARDGLRDQPDLAEEVRADVEVLLVDEFQDTSTVQRDLVYLLREREDARRGRRPGDVPPARHLERHGLFLVGDRKQSIYGFRGADVAVFSRICAELGGEAAALALRLSRAAGPEQLSPWGEAAADFVALAESRRSGAAVLGFVNAFSACDFSEGRSAEASARDFEVEYSPAEHLVPVRPPEERGDVVLIEDDGSVPEDADALTREAEGPLREALVAAAWIARELAGGAAGEQASGAAGEQAGGAAGEQAGGVAGEQASGVAGGAAGGAAVAPARRRARDIAVLARRRNTLPLVSVALDRLGVPYVVAGRALYDAPEVRDVAALVRLVVDPRDRHALATVLRGPCVALSETALAALSEPGRGLAYVATMPSLPDRVTLLTSTEHRRLTGFRATFGALRRAALRAPPAEALRALVSGFDLDRALAALPRAEARLANVDRLIAIAAERGGSLASFARWLDRRIADETDEPEGVVFSDDDDAVRLLTIHGSKGLDFKVVVLVDLAAEPRPTYPGVDLVPPLGDRPPSLLLRHFAPLEPRPAAIDPREEEPPQLHALPTPALRAAQAEARAREQAERRRLTYVALTRARDRIALVTPATPPRGSSAWRTLAVALPPEARVTVTQVERAADLLRAASAAAAARPAEGAQGAAASGAAAASSVGLRTGLASVEPAGPESVAGASIRAGSSSHGAAGPASTAPRGSSFSAAAAGPESVTGASIRAGSSSQGAAGPASTAVPSRVASERFDAAAPPRPPVTARTVALPVTAMSLFEGCPRRYRLRFLLGFDEPLASSQLDLFSLEEADDGTAADRLDEEDARDVGRAAHRVLERWPAARWGERPAQEEIVERLVAEGVERTSPDMARLASGIARWLGGAYVHEALGEEAAFLREEPFVLEVGGDPGQDGAASGPSKQAGARAAAHGRGAALALRGAIDLVVRVPGRVDVIDYKRSKPRSDLSPYVFQLQAYALAAARRFPGHRVRAGVLFLGAAERPAWLGGDDAPGLSSEDHGVFEASLAALAADYAAARADDVWEAVQVERCRALRCGFVTACHRRSKGR